MAEWIDGDSFKVGDVGFLIESVINVRGLPTKLALRERPAHTNMSHEPRIGGWCGETNNINIWAHGVARVSRVAKNGRIEVVRLKGDELSSALERLGYSQLDPKPRLPGVH